MRVKEQKTYTNTITTVSRLVCDICGEQSKGDNWSKERYQVAESEVSLLTGDRYPDCGSEERLRFDICPACFLNKLVPWVKAQNGMDPEVEDCSW